MKKLILIDGNAILHKGYHALPPFRSSEGDLVNAVYGFASVILNLLNEQNPDYIATAFDVKGGTFRHEKSVEYKATRTKAPDDLYAQIPLIKDLLAAFEVPVIEAPGYEADDVLGTLATQASEKDISTYIVTGDLDTLQLVDDKVRVLAMHRGFSRPIIFDREAVFERYSLWPEQIIDMKALQGDSSDNIKGVPGIGKKTAQTLLERFQTIEGVYEGLEELKGAVKKKLEEGREDAVLSKELATIVRAVPGVALDLVGCQVHEFEEEAVRGAFARFGFRSLERKLDLFLKKVIEKRNSEVQGSLF